MGSAHQSRNATHARKSPELFSATFSKEIKKLASWVFQPEMVEATPDYRREGGAVCLPVDTKEKPMY
jgi:hypothetical protein